MEEYSIENARIKDAQLEARAGELLTYMNKWNMTAEEAGDTLYRAESLIRQKRDLSLFPLGFRFRILLSCRRRELRIG